MYFEKVSPYHPDKIADRIAGAVVDMAYRNCDRPLIACEVLIGHGQCEIMIEAGGMATKALLKKEEIVAAAQRIAEDENLFVSVDIYPQDKKLYENQIGKIRVGDNGVFHGEPLRNGERAISKLARDITRKYATDGKYLMTYDGGRNAKYGVREITICQSWTNGAELKEKYPRAKINPLGQWTGGINVDTGCTNRKLQSDLGCSNRGNGLHGKDCSKADVSVTIYAFLKAQRTGKRVDLCTTIGDEYVDGKPYAEIVEEAYKYIQLHGGFEKLAEWGLF